MEREIKFRAWHKGRNEWLHHANHACNILGEMILFGGWCNVPLEELNDVVVMQFTGIKDDHGQEIYEGDILEATYAPTYELKSYEVKWSSLRAAFVCYRPEKPPVNFCNLPLQPSNSMENLKVLGNIYDNPELQVK